MHTLRGMEALSVWLPSVNASDPTKLTRLKNITKPYSICICENRHIEKKTYFSKLTNTGLDAKLEKVFRVHAQVLLIVLTTWFVNKCCCDTRFTTSTGTSYSVHCKYNETNFTCENNVCGMELYSRNPHHLRTFSFSFANRFGTVFKVCSHISSGFAFTLLRMGPTATGVGVYINVCVK